ncbi:unnamed protein product, partial [Bubo scandiacus]
KMDAREAPIKSWLHNSLCFLERNVLNHLACWKDLISVADIVTEARGNTGGISLLALSSSTVPRQS